MENWSTGRWIVVILIAFVLLLPISLCGRACNWVGEARQVAAEQVAPRELLRKYEWFKDMAAALDVKQAQIATYRASMEAIKVEYPDSKTWPEDVRRQFFQWRTEVAGVTSKYNSMAGEYNAQMAKINWAFTNVGQLPKGAVEPLPREYKPYEVL